ncbi:MAG: hypothetical protein RIM99_08425 [Cyclobacteriaceae bacterium]
MTTPASKSKRIGSRIFFYLGSAWVVVEAFSFLIERYSLDPFLLELLIILVLFGLPGTFIHTSFTGRFNKKAIGLHVLNGIVALSVLFYFMSNPLVFNPGKLRVLKLGDNKGSFESLNSVAVLPFVNNLGDDDHDYLLAGMHDGLITEIGQLGSIHVISRTSTLSYAGTNKGVRQITKELEVDAVIETSITRADTLVEVSIKLISAVPKERLLWSSSFSTSMGQLPNLYKEVTKNVALELNKVLSPEELEKLQPKRPIVPGAYEAHLRGRYYTGYLTPEGFELAKSQFEKAIAIDSMFGLPYGGLAGVLGSRRQMGYVSGAEVNPVIDRLVEKAFELDSLSAELLAGFAAHLTWTKFDWEEAERYFLRSIEMNPNDAITRAYYAHYLMIRDRWKEAWNQMEIGIELDPKNPWVVAFSSAMYFFDGKMLSASKNAELLIRMAPDHPMANEMLLGKYVALGKHDLAVEELKKFVGRTGDEKLGSMIDELYKKDDFAGTVRKLAIHIESLSNEIFVSPRIIYGLFEIIKDREKQLFWMEKMFEVSDPNLPYYAIRNSDPIQDDPTYRMIMREIGLW